MYRIGTGDGLAMDALRGEDIFMQMLIVKQQLLHTKADITQILTMYRTSC